MLFQPLKGQRQILQLLVGLLMLIQTIPKEVEGISCHCKNLGRCGDCGSGDWVCVATGEKRGCVQRNLWDCTMEFGEELCKRFSKAGADFNDVRKIIEDCLDCDPLTCNWDMEHVRAGTRLCLCDEDWCNTDYFYKTSVPGDPPTTTTTPAPPPAPVPPPAPPVETEPPTTLSTLPTDTPAKTDNVRITGPTQQNKHNIGDPWHTNTGYRVSSNWKLIFTLVVITGAFMHHQGSMPC